jgi:hypothetical protein
VIASTERPILLVDVDGVILPFGRPLSDEVAFDGIVIDEHEHRVARDVRDLFARLEAVFECVWATAWEEKAPPAIAPIVGTGSSWPVITFPLVEGFRTWKLPGVQSWCERHAGDRPVVWVEDELDVDAIAWAKRRGNNTLLLPTDPTVGLTAEHVEAALSWATATVQEVGPSAS